METRHSESLEALTAWFRERGCELEFLEDADGWQALAGPSSEEGLVLELGRGETRLDAARAAHAALMRLETIRDEA